MGRKLDIVVVLAIRGLVGLGADCMLWIGLSVGSGVGSGVPSAGRVCIILAGSFVTGDEVLYTLARVPRTPAAVIPPPQAQHAASALLPQCMYLL